jgi:hypothetical protein
MTMMKLEEKVDERKREEDETKERRQTGRGRETDSKLKKTRMWILVVPD